MQCPECGADNPEVAKFCLNCRARLALVCPECSAALPPHAKFCFQCGARLSTPAAELSLTEQQSTYLEALQRLVPKGFAERLQERGYSLALREPGDYT